MFKEPRLALATIEQRERKLRRGNRQRNPGQATAAAEIENSRTCDEWQDAEAVEHVARPDPVDIAARQQIDALIPLQEECNVVGEQIGLCAAEIHVEQACVGCEVCWRSRVHLIERAAACAHATVICCVRTCIHAAQLEFFSVYE